MEEETVENIDTILLKFDDPVEGWDSRAARKHLAKKNSEWIVSMRPWMIFLTLTFREETPPDVAKNKFFYLVRILNKELFGNQYSRFVGHSYFSYVLGIEYQRRDVIHFHVLIDRPVNFELIHRIWNLSAGFAWTDVIRDTEQTVNYVSKYITKGGEIIPFPAEKEYTPNQLPLLWEPT